MNQKNIKALMITLLVLWMFLFSVDSMIGIDWPNYTVKRIFIWCPTVLIAIYWMLFGGKKKEGK